MVLRFWLCLLLAPAWLWSQVWLGVSFLEQKSPQGLELLVQGVHPSSGALAAGIASGDAIVGVQGATLQNLGQLQQALKNARAGSKLALQVRRAGGEVVKMQVELTPRPQDLRNFMNSPVGTKVGEFKENIYANGAQMSARPKARLLDFWATWCMPCRRTFPLLKNLYAQYHSRGLDIVGLSSEDLAVLNSFQSQEKLPWPLVRDINGVQSQYYGVRGLPTLILTDSLGYVQKVWTGAPAPAQLESEIKKLLGVK